MGVGKASGSHIMVIMTFIVNIILSRFDGTLEIRSASNQDPGNSTKKSRAREQPLPGSKKTTF